MILIYLHTAVEGRQFSTKRGKSEATSKALLSTYKMSLYQELVVKPQWNITAIASEIEQGRSIETERKEGEGEGKESVNEASQVRDT